MANARLKNVPKQVPVTGKHVTRVPGFVLLGIGAAKSGQVLPKDRASTLVSKAARALNKPGIDRDVVFKGKKADVYSYSVDTTDVSRVVRVSANGERKVGRLVGDKFVPVKAA